MQLAEKDVAFFRSLTKGVITDPDALEPYNRDWTHKYTGQSRLALQPASVGEVSAILRYCNAARLAVVPQGGNTGLVGGGVPLFDEIILSLSRLDTIHGFDEDSAVLTVAAGCILETADQYVRERGHVMPLDLGAKGSCQVGGNLATNAGGIRLIRYGSLPGNVLGVQAVLADGRVLDGMSANRKDNTGYSLKHLLVGSEGTLGVITAANILCPRAPAAVNSALLAVGEYALIPRILREAKGRLGEILSAFEFWDAGSQALLDTHMPAAGSPLAGSGAPFYVLIETHGSSQAHDQEKMAGLLEHLAGTALVTDGVLAQDQAQTDAFWRLRESIPEACSKEGVVYKYDVTLHPAGLYGLVTDMRARLHASDASSVIGYGHVGDGNLHLNIAAPAVSSTLLDLIEPYVYQYVQARGGSVSAEHGIGVMKTAYLGMSKDPVSIQMMGAIKRAFDPAGILNPYKVLPAA